MKGKQEIVNINQIVVDEEKYPRSNPDWFLTNKYSKAMQAGAVFPPITLGLFRGKRYLVDGRHRLEAYKTNKFSEVQCETVAYKTEAELFADAVKANTVHGKPLSTQETVNCINRLRDLKFTDQQISGIVSIPVERINNFVVSRMTNTITGEEVVLKAPLKHLHGVDISDEAFVGQEVYAARNQMQIVEQMLSLLETKTINTKNKELMNKLKIIHKLIEKEVLKTRKN